MISDITDFLLKSIDSIGYLGLFITMFIEVAVFPPIPSEIILGAVGLLVHNHDINYPLAVLVASFGNTIGVMFLYTLARIGGRPFVKKFGKYFFFEEEALAKSEKWFHKYGDILLFLAQVVPTVRSLLSIPAGILKKSALKVFIFTWLGAALWAALIIGLASVFGKSWEKVVTWLDRYSTATLIIIAIVFVFVVIYRIYIVRKNEIEE